MVSTTLLFPKFPVKQIPLKYQNSSLGTFRRLTTPCQFLRSERRFERRCLQNVIQEKEGIVEKTLFAEVDKLIKLNKLPRHLADDLDAIRHIGSFAAHPLKDTNTGEILDVEAGEAEWTFKVLEGLLSLYFVDEPKSAARRAALNQKLKDAGKGRMLKP